MECHWAVLNPAQMAVSVNGASGNHHGVKAEVSQETSLSRSEPKLKWKTEVLLIFLNNAYFILSGSFLGTSKKNSAEVYIDFFCKFYRGHQITHFRGIKQ